MTDYSRLDMSSIEKYIYARRNVLYYAPYDIFYQRKTATYMKIISPEEKRAPSEKQSRPNMVIPYFDLDQSIKVAQVVHEHGGGRCLPEQLAHWLGYTSAKSGTYMMRFYSAKYFGLITATRDSISITDRALAIIAPVLPEDSIQAKLAAFLDIPLFTNIYERFRGQALPPEVGLKNLFHGTYKISYDRLQSALRVFYNSAEQAGFFQISGDRSRLITPVIARQTEKKVTSATKEESTVEKQRTTGGGSGGEGPPSVHSAIIGLLRELPPPGTPWNSTNKKRFLDAFKATIDFIYPEENTP